MIDIALRLIPLVLSGVLVAYQHSLAACIDSMRLMEPRRETPFHLRWIAPALCRQWPSAWLTCTLISIVAIGLLLPDVWTVWLFACIPWYRCIVRYPALVDAPGFALALGIARLSQHGHGWWAAGLSVVGAGVYEKVPVFAALYARDWRPLLGIIAVACAHALIPHTPRGTYQGHPQPRSAWQIGRDAHRKHVSSLQDMLLIWGTGVTALLAPWDAWGIATVAIAYGQLFVAHDLSRMLGWAAPAILPRAVSVIPAPWRPAAIAVSWVMPACRMRV